MNRDLLSKMLIFVTGAGVGSAVAYKLLKTKYDKLIQEEIDSVKEAFSRDVSDGSVDGKDIESNGWSEKNRKDNLETVKDVISQNGYVTKSTGKEEKGEEVEKVEGNTPYIISPAEFGECDYGVISLDYYTDGVIVDSCGDIIENVDELLGDDFAAHFGDYEEDPDTVYVRNDGLEIDYEILKNNVSYSEI